MKVFVQINDETIFIECGTGRNKISWLCNSALHRYDKNYGLDTGMWTSIEDEHGAKISPDAPIADKIADNSRIILKFEEVKLEEEKTSKSVSQPKKK
jgi:N-terminal of Par3 and HAL proteins